MPECLEPESIPIRRAVPAVPGCTAHPVRPTPRGGQDCGRLVPTQVIVVRTADFLPAFVKQEATTSQNKVSSFLDIKKT